MKKIFFGLIFLAACMAMPAHAIGLKGGISWDMSTTLGKYTKFANMYSMRGGSIWVDFNVTKHWAVGIDAGFHQLYENKDRASFELAPGSVVTASTYNRLYDIPVMATLKYTIIARGILHPYVGIGIGAVYTREEIIFMDMALREKSWNFGLAPTVGIQLTFGQRIPVGLNIFAKYGISFNDYTYRNEELNPYQYFNIGVGLLFQ